MKFTTLVLACLLFAGVLGNKRPPLYEDGQVPPFTLPPNYCINEKDPNNLSTKDQLAEFVKGPCSPAILIPGYMGSKLRMVIDCQVLMEKNKRLANICGWSRCDFIGSLRGLTPKREYQVWVPDPDSPFSLFSLYGKSANCFGEIFSLVFNPNTTDPELMFDSVPGVKITWHGNTPETVKQGTCGNTAGEDLLNHVYAKVISPTSMGIKETRRYMEYLGYQPGLTYQVVPFDYRRSVVASDGVYKLNRTLRLFKDLTGKKTVIMGHSQGNLVTNYLLSTFAQREKDDLIQLWYAVVPPLIGASRGVRASLGGDKNLMFLSNYGVLINGQKPMIQSYGVIMDLLPGFSSHLFKDEPWMREILERSEHEGRHLPHHPQGANFWTEYKKNTSKVFKFFPTPLEKCSPSFKQRPDGCYMNIVDTAKESIATIEGNKFGYRGDEVVDMLKKYSMKTSYVDEYMKLRNQSRVLWLDNPGVPVALGYLAHLKTTVEFKYDKNPKLSTDKMEFADPLEEISSLGDGTVPTYSTLLPALKWAYEFETKDTKSNVKKYPVKIIELCSMHNQKGHFYDTKSTTESNTITENEYIGVSCKCMSEPELTRMGFECGHSLIPNDIGFLNYFGVMLASKDHNPEFKNAAFQKMSSAQLDNLVWQCPQLRYPRSKDVTLSSFM